MASQNEPLHSYRHAPIEFCEVASMAMELLGSEFLEEFYNSEEARRARINHLEGIVFVFPWIATVDAFQHWLYLNPDSKCVTTVKGRIQSFLVMPECILIWFAEKYICRGGRGEGGGFNRCCVWGCLVADRPMHYGIPG